MRKLALGTRLAVGERDDITYALGAPGAHRLQIGVGIDRGPQRVEEEQEVDPLRPAQGVERVRIVGPGYLRTMGIPLHRGRDLEPTDRVDAPVVGARNDGVSVVHEVGADLPEAKAVQLFALPGYIDCEDGEDGYCAVGG